MTITRRSGVSEARPLVEKRPTPLSSPQKSSRKRRRVVESDAAPEVVAEDPQSSQNETTLSSRPKRTIRKSVLLSDYEVMLPNAVKEEPGEEKEEGAAPTAVVEEVDEQFVDIESSHEDEMIASVKAEERAAAIARKPHPRRVAAAPPPYIEPEDPNVEGEVDIEGIELMGQDESGMVTLADALDVALEEEVSGGEEDDQPPMLEKSAERRRPRGRPRKHSPSHVIPRPTRTGRLFPLPRSRYVADKAISKGEAEKINNYNIKLFENEVGVTEYGDRYATVIPGCLSYLLRKERIVELLTEPSDIEAIREQGWMSIKPPRLPPLVGTKACFAFYIEGSTVSSVRELSSDDLKPWTTTDPVEGEPTIKPNVRKHAVARVDGRFEPCKGDGRSSEFHLTEYSAWLPRLLRLRKKIFYVARQTGQIVGNVLILYDFTMPGEIPSIMNIAHGNDALRDMQQLDLGLELPVADADNPFIEGVVPGVRGEKFLRVHPSKIGWVNNKTLLLKYLINDPTFLDEAGYLNTHVPFLPPMIEGRGVFVHFAPATLVSDHIHHTGDGLSPWTFQGASMHNRVRTVKRALMQDSEGVFRLTKQDWQQTGLALVETITVLARCPRLRKRVVFIQRNNRMVLGIVCFMYEYIREGPLPEILRDNSITVPGPPITSRQPSALSTSVDKSHSSDIHGNGGVGDDFVDVEEIVEATDENDMSMSGGQGDYEEMHEDCLDGGWDGDFDEDLLASQENSDPFIDGVRELESGHVYLTVRHKRLAGSLDTILQYIANTNFVENHDILNNTKPQHPPLVRNARAYAFFVAGNIVYPHDINRDDFSPWSGNGTPENPTCYRTKVRKFPVETDEVTGLFRIGHGDYRTSPYHLVHLYSIHPKETRLRKKIAYLMETESRTIISHVMIMYDYHTEGPVPRIRGPYSKRFMRQKPRRPMIDVADTLDDVSDVSESEKESPFGLGPQQAEDGSIFLDLSDMEFLNDRNRQLHYLINKPRLVENLGCLNTRVPMFPPMTTSRGTFIFFIDGGEVDIRNLTCDALSPWSESLQMSDGSIMCRRPKTSKISLGLNREGQLRVMKMSRSQGTDYQMHIYAATLPRLPRLKKRVIYLTKGGMQIGHSMIVYWYTEEGALPTQVPHGNSITSEALYTRLPPSVRDEARRLLANHPPSEVAEMLSSKTNYAVAPRALYNIRRELRRDQPRYVDVKLEGSGLDDLDYIPDWLQADIAHAKKLGELTAAQGIVDGGDIDVSHTEEVEQAVGSPVRKMNPVRLANTPAGSGHSLREDAVWRYAREAFEAGSNEAVFDALWRLLLEKNEPRLLQNIKSDFGIEIVADHHPLIVEDESLEAMVVTDDGLVSAEIVDEERIPEGATIENVEIVEESVVVGEHPPAIQDEAQEGQKEAMPKDAVGAIHIGEEVEIQSVETVKTER
uniref:SET domain-containing protein n=2 Tax=Trichostrongylidae TaxID=6315 RepID=A0A7I4XSF1_HAECO